MTIGAVNTHVMERALDEVGVVLARVVIHPKRLCLRLWVDKRPRAGVAQRSAISQAKKKMAPSRSLSAFGALCDY